MWDLVSWPGIKPRPHALGVQSLSHWTTKEVLLWKYLVIEDIGVPSKENRGADSVFLGAPHLLLPCYSLVSLPSPLPRHLWYFKLFHGRVPHAAFFFCLSYVGGAMSCKKTGEVSRLSSIRTVCFKWPRSDSLPATLSIQMLQDLSPLQTGSYLWILFPCLLWNTSKRIAHWTCLVAQWLWIRLPMQGTWGQGFDSWFRKIPCASGQLNLRTTTEAAHSRVCPRAREAATTGSLQPQLESRPQAASGESPHAAKTQCSGK